MSALPICYWAQGTEYLLNFEFGGQQYQFKLPGGSPSYVKNVDGSLLLWEGGMAEDPFPRMLDPALWQYRRVPYPAALIFGGKSVEYGVDWVINDIESYPVGTPFALSGYSGGAAIMSRVYNECRQGRLAHRRADLRAMVTFGNPMRETNHTWPGSSGWSGVFDDPGSTRGGHGVYPSAESMNIFDPFVSRFARLKDTEPLVWDFVMPNEMANGMGDSFESLLMQQYTKDSMREIPALAVLTVVPALILLGTRFKEGPVQLVNSDGSRSTITAAGHGMYPFYAPPNADGSINVDGDTCYQIGARHLNEVGAVIWDEMHPSIPVPTFPAGYQWFSSLPNG